MTTPETGPKKTGTIASPAWSSTTKIIVVVVGLILIAIVVSRFRQVISMMAVAAIFAFVLHPLISYLSSRLHIRRGLAVLLVYFLLAALLLAVASLLGIGAVQQVTTFVNQAPTLLAQTVTTIGTFVQRTEPINLGPLTIDPIMIPWDQVQQQLLGLFEPAFSRSASFITSLATSTVRTITQVVFIFVLSIYLSIDQPHFDSYILRFTRPTGYHKDAEIILSDLKLSWSAYLRGQVLLGLVIFIIVWIGLSIIGVQNALALGLIAGLLEFIPNVGPVLATVIAVLVAAFQPENHFGLPVWLFIAIIIGFMIIVQQLENNLLVPRIVGRALNLKPIIVILGVFMGASLAGVLGAVLAAPVLASLKILGDYTWKKLFDLPPFPERDPDAAESAAPLQAAETPAAARPRSS